MKRSETAETANSKKNFWFYGHDRMSGAPLDCPDSLNICSRRKVKA